MTDQAPSTKHQKTKPPVVASYVADFLKRDMRHIFRQITGLEAVTPWVLTHKRENAAEFPFPEKRLIVLPRPRFRWWRRLVSRQVTGRPWQLRRWELRWALLELTRAEARVLHVYFGHIAVHLRPLLRVFPRPVVVSFHGADAGVDLQKPAHLAALREVFGLAAVVQARSESLLRDLAGLGCPREKLWLQRTGIPLEEWQFSLRKPLADGAWRLLQSCRLIPKKGVDVTLRAFAELRRSHSQAQLVIAGDGPAQEELQELARELGLGGNVRFTGFLGQAALREEIDRAHVFVHPSRVTADGNREGVPNSLLEAMAAGLPVVATRHGGIPEAVTDGEGGFLVPENDAGAVAAGLREILSRGDLYERFAVAGRRMVEERFDRATNVHVLETCYLDLMNPALHHA